MLKRLCKTWVLLLWVPAKLLVRPGAELAALDAISSPLLENVSIEGARSILLNITASSKLGLHEVHTAASIIQGQAHKDASIILGSVIDDTVGDDLYVTVIATGFSCPISYEKEPVREVSPAPISAPEQYYVSSVASAKVEAQPAPAVQPVHVEHTPNYSLTQHEKTAVQASGSSQEDLEIPTLLRKMVRKSNSLKTKVSAKKAPGFPGALLWRL